MRVTGVAEELGRRVRDTKLDRDVALKVLPEAFTSDPDRLARFERETKCWPRCGSSRGHPQNAANSARLDWTHDEDTTKHSLSV